MDFPIVGIYQIDNTDRIIRTLLTGYGIRHDTNLMSDNHVSGVILYAKWSDARYVPGFRFNNWRMPDQFEPITEEELVILLLGVEIQAISAQG